MSCREYRSGLIELARARGIGAAAGKVLVAHLEQCEECAQFLEAQQALTVAMRELSAARIPSASELSEPVMAAFDRAHPATRRARVVAIRWVAVAGLAAAICAAVVSMQHPRMTAPPSPVIALPTAMESQPALVSTPGKQTSAVHHAVLRPPAREMEQPFFPIPYTLPLAPGEWTRVERMEIPVAALIAVGFHVPVSDPAATVEADVLVSQDGRARAIRALSISISN